MQLCYSIVMFRTIFRFNEMATWMDHVDESVYKMSQDAISAKEFEEIEEQFKVRE